MKYFLAALFLLAPSLAFACCDVSEYTYPHDTYLTEISDREFGYLLRGTPDETSECIANFHGWKKKHRKNWVIRQDCKGVIFTNTQTSEKHFCDFPEGYDR